MFGGHERAFWVLVWKSEGKRPFGGPRHRLEDIIKMYLQEVGWWGYQLD